MRPLAYVDTFPPPELKKANNMPIPNMGEKPPRRSALDLRNRPNRRRTQNDRSIDLLLEPPSSCAGLTRTTDYRQPAPEFRQSSSVFPLLIKKKLKTGPAPFLYSAGASDHDSLGGFAPAVGEIPRRTVFPEAYSVLGLTRDPSRCWMKKGAALLTGLPSMPGKRRPASLCRPGSDPSLSPCTTSDRPDRRDPPPSRRRPDKRPLRY